MCGHSEHLDIYIFCDSGREWLTGYRYCVFVETRQIVGQITRYREQTYLLNPTHTTYGITRGYRPWAKRPSFNYHLRFVCHLVTSITLHVEWKFLIDFEISASEFGTVSMHR